MIQSDVFEALVRRASLAPSVHNIQPARWRLNGNKIELGADLAVRLPVADPRDADIGLSCGAAVEATVLALGDLGFSARVTELWEKDDRQSWPGHRIVAQIELEPGPSDPLGQSLEHRFTWRDAFEPAPFTAWDQPDAIFVTDQADKDWIAERNDWASLQIMNDRPFRQELTSWMRLSAGHPRHAFDGLSREAMQMPKRDALLVRWALGPLWPLLHLFKATPTLTAEASKTASASTIACFHRPPGESVIASGRAYLRLCLAAAAQGLAGWPMAALTDHPETLQALSARFLPFTDRRLVQVLRFGVPRGIRPPTARRPLKELIP